LLPTAYRFKVVIPWLETRPKIILIIKNPIKIYLSII